MTKEEEAQIEAAAASLFTKIAAVKADLLQAKTLSQKLALVPDIVHHIEVANKSLKLAGPLKRELAIRILNKAIDLPYASEHLEAILIGLAIDAVVKAYNKFGKEWVDKVLPPAQP